MNFFIFLSFSFFFVLIIGRLLEKIRVPWVFAALLLGALLSVSNPFKAITDSDSFSLLAQLGMYFLLFMIGLELDLNEVKKKGKFIFKATFFIIFLEALGGSLLVHYLFSYSWAISFLVALSFATVGEAILIPILDEFKIINTKLGQAIIGIGTVDDLIEMAILIVVAIFIGTKAESQIFIILGALAFLFLLTAESRRLEKKGERFKFKSIETLFFFMMSVLLLYIGIGSLAEAAPIAALLAGISLKTFIPEKRFNLIESEVKTFAYGFFVPIFFLWVGVTLDFSYLIAYPLLIFAVVAVSKSIKLLGSYLVAKKELGTRQSILLGIGLSVRFSTSIVIIKILLDNGVIGIGLYSVIIASSIVFKFIVPVLFSNLLVRWKVVKPRLSILKSHI